MIVDMDAAFRSQCAQALKKQNIEVVAEADNGHDAYLLSLRTKPKVILCDLYVGKMDGVQLLKDLHKQLVDEETSFIMLASFTNQNLFEECCNAGATYCMIKPLDYSLLAERIERICDKAPPCRRQGAGGAGRFGSAGDEDHSPDRRTRAHQGVLLPAVGDHYDHQRR